MKVIVTKLRGGQLLVRPQEFVLGLHPVVVELGRLLKQVERFGELMSATQREMLRMLTQARTDGVNRVTRQAIWDYFVDAMRALLKEKFSDIEAEMRNCILPADGR